MEENIVIQTYSVADLKNWLLHNRAITGLSSEVIAPTRAFAIMNNPFVTDETRVVCALFVNDKLAAFTAAFPEVLQKPENRLAWWFTTLWCDEKYEGRGFGLVVIGTLCEFLDCLASNARTSLAMNFLKGKSIRIRFAEN